MPFEDFRLRGARGRSSESSEVVLLFRFPIDFARRAESRSAGSGFGSLEVWERNGEVEPGVPEALYALTKREESSSLSVFRGVPLRVEPLLPNGSGDSVRAVAVTDMEDIFGGALSEGVRCNNREVI